MGSSRLTPEERSFFSLVNQAVLANPFSDHRIDIDRKIGGLFPDTPRYDALVKAIHDVGSRVTALEKEGRGNISYYSGKDREILQITYLFVVFHRFIFNFDDLIVEQLKEGKVSVKVEFARDIFVYLRERGFSHDEILHFIALCYQLRRAFYFIDRGLVGRSLSMQKLRESLWNNVVTCDLSLYGTYLWSRMEDFSTLILGETGTGKGTAARAIGQSGFIPFDEKQNCFKESFCKTFLPLNISQFSESLIESELFGHKKGSFTGAMGDHKGVFDQCSPHGAIFLDEIGEISVPVQIKLLKILEERVFSPVGSHDEHRFEGRIIAATNKDINTLQMRGAFRSDFFYRLCSDIIVVPPLRERIAEDPEELDDLLAYTVEKIVGMPSEDLTTLIAKEIRKQLGLTYDWPGNVRELGQCVRRMLLKRSYAHAGYTAASGPHSELAAHMDQGNFTALDLMKAYCRMLHEKHGTIGEVARITKLDKRTVKNI